MGEARDGQRTRGNSLMWPMPAVAGNPLFAVVTDINGKLLENVARVQKDWAEFVHRRVKEDIAAARRLVIVSRSPTCSRSTRSICRLPCNNIGKNPNG